LILFLIVPFFRLEAFQSDDPSTDQEPKPNVITKIAPKVDKTQDQISKQVTSTALWLDSFFKDEAYEAEINTTYLRITADAFQESGESTEFNFSPSLKLVLPYLEKKVHLEITSSANEDLDVYDEKPALENRQLDEVQKSPTAATIRYFIEAKDKFNLSLAAGAYVDDNKPQMHIGPRSRMTFDYQLLKITFIEWLRWLTNYGLESETRIDLDYKVPGPVMFRTRLEGDWSDDEDEFENSVGFLLYHPLSERRMMVYEWENLFTNKPGYRLEETNFMVKYRQRIWRDWLFAEVAPQLSFPRDRDFRRTPGILFRIELYFGYTD